MLILIAHGSRNPAWRTSVERVVKAVCAEFEDRDAVRLAYMDCTPPTLMDVASDAVRGGTKSLRVLPLFLADEGHVDRDVRALVEEVRRAHPQAEVELLPAMGQHQAFVKLLYEIAAAAG